MIELGIHAIQGLSQRKQQYGIVRREGRYGRRKTRASNRENKRVPFEPYGVTK